jgi:hypothetical protein
MFDCDHQAFFAREVSQSFDMRGVTYACWAMSVPGIRHSNIKIIFNDGSFLVAQTGC